MKASSGEDKLFSNLNHLFSLFKNNPSVLQLNKKFLSTIGSSDIREKMPGASNSLKAAYEEAVKFVEEEVVKSGFKEDLLMLQRNLYTELEHILSLIGHDPRHHFMLVIPVADRPLMLSTCLDSITEQCRTFQYGGTKVNAEGIPVFQKITLFIIDDSKDESNIKKIKEISSTIHSSGIQTHYIGKNEQSAVLNRIPPGHRRKLSRLIGEFSDIVPFHKGASITRNIAYLYIHQILNGSGEKALIYFLDSDEEFRIKIKSGNTSEDIQFINYFYWIDKIFSSSDTEVLTGKVVGDPPVSPSVMINTFLDDLILFFDTVSGLGMYNTCVFHELQPSGIFSAEYHDMVKLFGYKSPQSPKRYQCSLSRAHDVKDCFDDFSRKSISFFCGLHPTRTQFYNHTGSFTQTEYARTVYTGNYVFNSDGLRHFIPFADLKLRMAGPTLGRILRKKLGKRFVSANLPLLHKRTISDKHTDEFRRGVLKINDNVDLSEEFLNQFWGDVMLFSVDALTASGFPERPIVLSEIADTVNDVRENIWKSYNKQRSETAAKLSRIRDYLSCAGSWWNIDSGVKEAVNNFKIFCSTVESNFGTDSESLRKLSEQIEEGSYTQKIINAIHSFHEDDDLWDEILKSKHTKLTKQEKN